MDLEMVRALDRGFEDAFGGRPQRYFSAPGRTEVGGNHTDHQRGLVLAAALALCDRFLQGQGAFRVHGGGFAGTVQAFVPLERLEDFRAQIQSVLGEGSCVVLPIRQEGGVELFRT